MTTAILARSASEIEETARTIEQSGGRARPFVTDVTDAAAVRISCRVADWLGKSDLVVEALAD